MGTQPESEEQVETPVNELESAVVDVEVDATLDLALHYEAPIPFDDVDATPLAMCQICMDFYGSKEVVRNVCGPECPAEVCPDCLIQHLTASVYSYYPGVLPKLRCPACLVALNKIQWKKFVMPEQITTESNDEDDNEDEIDTPEDEDNDDEQEDANDEQAIASDQRVNDDDEWAMDHSHVMEKFEVLCHQSCGFQAPCCHNTEYSMLPRIEERHIKEQVTMKLPTSQAAHVLRLSTLFKDYCFHRVEVAELYDFIMDNFGANAEDMLNVVLSNIVDDERRAHLLLLHLFHNPDTYTTCCNHAVCFKCKTAVHHNGNCGDFEVDENVLDCPGCRVTLVKVDGCDSVTCVCGYAIEWPTEMQKQRLQRKQLAPLDNREYSNWFVWSYNFEPCLNAIDELDVTLRRHRLQRMLHQHREVLQLLVDRAIRRARLNILIREHRERLRPLVRAHIERRKASMDQTPSKQPTSSMCGDGVSHHFAPAA